MLFRNMAYRYRHYGSQRLCCQSSTNIELCIIYQNASDSIDQSTKPVYRLPIELMDEKSSKSAKFCIVQHGTPVPSPTIGFLISLITFTTFWFWSHMSRHWHWLKVLCHRLFYISKLHLKFL